MPGVTGYTATVHVRTTTVGGATVLTESGVAVAGSRGATKQAVT